MLPTAIGAITLFVEDLPTSKAFYLNAFGRPVSYEDDVSAVFSFGTTLVNLLDVAEAPGLVEPASVARDFAKMRAGAINAIRIYNPPPAWLLDLAEEHGQLLLVETPCPKHLDFLESAVPHRPQ